MIDLLSYLPDEILVKVDRASMAVGLECREPLLDHRMVELAWRLPRHFKTDGRRGKLILRSLLERHLPRALFDRPKQGFSVPVAEWLRGPLRDWAESLLSSERIERDGFFEPSIVRTAWHEHLSRRSTLDGKLWTILMFQAWLDERRSRAKVS